MITMGPLPFDQMFNREGICDKCGKQLVSLKGVAHLAAYAGFPTNAVRTKDSIVYHAGDTLQSTRMGCGE